MPEDSDQECESPACRIVDSGTILALHEVYFDRDGRPIGKRDKPKTFYGFGDDARSEIIEGLELALAAARTAPIITPADIARGCDESWALYGNGS